MTLHKEKRWFTEFVYSGVEFPWRATTTDGIPPTVEAVKVLYHNDIWNVDPDPRTWENISESHLNSLGASVQAGGHTYVSFDLEFWAQDVDDEIITLATRIDRYATIVGFFTDGGYTGELSMYNVGAPFLHYTDDFLGGGRAQWEADSQQWWDTMGPILTAMNPTMYQYSSGEAGAHEPIDDRWQEHAQVRIDECRSLSSTHRIYPYFSWAHQGGSDAAATTLNPGQMIRQLNFLHDQADGGILWCNDTLFTDDLDTIPTCYRVFSNFVEATQGRGLRG